MANKPEFDNASFWESCVKLIKEFIKEPRKGAKATSILLYLLGGVGFYFFIFTRLDWARYDPIIAYAFAFGAVVLYLSVFFPLFVLWTKFDRRLA